MVQRCAASLSVHSLVAKGLVAVQQVFPRQMRFGHRTGLFEEARETQLAKRSVFLES